MNDNRLGDGAILALFEDLALKAGQAIMKVYDAGFVTDTKADSSPVTEADRAAEKIILAGLRDGLEDVWCGDVARELAERWRQNPRVLERELAGDGQ